METIHVKSDELTTMASKHDSLEPVFQRFINDDLLVESMNIPSKEDLDNLFGPMYVENTLKEEHEAPPIVTTFEEKTSLISLNEADEFNQEDSVEFDGIVDPNLFTRRHGGDILLVQVYVDDIIIGSTKPDFSKRFANLMKSNFEMSMMGELKFFLGMDERVSMSTPMATERLDADLQGTPTDQMTYRRMIGGLMYLTARRPDIAFATFVYARYQARPMDSEFELIAFLDADHAGCEDDCKSTSGGLQFLGKKLVSWSSKKQGTAMSTTEAEIPMYCDSKSAIAISCNPVQHSRIKHIDIRYHFIKEHVEKGTVELYFVETEYQLADLFTKALPKECFEYLVHRIANVHQEELCPPNKRYALMDANKKIDLDNLLCPNESKIVANILQNHPLRFNIAASSSVPWIYLGQFWHTLKEDGSKHRLKFMLDRKELTLTLDDFWTIFQLPQATDNNHEHFVAAPKFSEMVPFYINDLGFTLELRSPSNFKTTDHADVIHKAYSESLHDCFPEISRRARDKYHNLDDDMMVKNIFNSGKHKDGIGMKIPSWRITDEMELTENYQMYATVFEVDVPMTQSQPIKSIQGT
ncbi:retrovirus-related pol polyprotein from transposon TNT 1-94 [Tanacetum coccineum]